MDSHFEVILSRVKTLTDESKKTVWFETHRDSNGSMVLILINQDEDIGLINVTYTNKFPELFATRLTKDMYESFLQLELGIDDIKNRIKKIYQPKEVVRWVSGLT